MTDANSNPQNQQQAFVSWFRDSSPYIHAHRNRTFVISFGGEAVLDAGFAHHVHDFALLNSLGVRLVLVHGIRPQIDARLRKLNSTPQFHNNLRITDALALQCVKEAAGLVRVETEALLSMGLANSPMAGARISVVSGNYVQALPIGVIEGIDYGYTGKVRRIDSQAIHKHLEQNNVVLISPIGYSPSGEVFNLSAETVATEVAIALKAEKLILLTEKSCVHPDGQTLQQLTTTEAGLWLQQNPAIDELVRGPLQAAIYGCQAGIERVHLVNRHQDGALLLELFSRDGSGTLISASPYESVRQAGLNDIAGILELITPLERQGKLIKRSPEKLEMDIGDYTIIERDGLIIACTALHSVTDAPDAGLIACLAVHPDYQKAARASHLLEHVLQQAQQHGMSKLFVLSTQTAYWFLERGFAPIAVKHLPEALKSAYNLARNAKILYKCI
ncbi:MAG: amino-acid N-acetyltransferase [Gammaproteobacteria bacterium HGW-Gammaproteobacteria-3]|nr:MAG: amino-acid N-acetyltransferase [Gammaproteobacteria bacterium HGW-Gammaproteobacteria-3]